MSSLYALWLTSLGMAGTALAIVAALMAARLLFGHRAEARAAERRRLVPLLLGEAGADVKPRLWLADDFIAGLMVELIQMVRGEERERFVARAEAFGVPERLRHQLRSGSPRLRQAAAEALAWFGDDASVTSLRATLRDPNPDMRLTAALSLAQEGREPPLRELAKSLDIGRTEKSLLVTGLFRDLAAERAVELEEMVADPAVPELARLAAVEALAQAGRYEAVPVIARAVAEADPASRTLPRCLAALGVLGHPAAAPAVARGLDHEAPAVRAAAAEAAGRIGLEELAGRLAGLLADASWRVRFRAGEALIRIGPTGIALLRKAAAGGDGDAAAVSARLILAEERLA